MWKMSWYVSSNMTSLLVGFSVANVQNSVRTQQWIHLFSSNLLFPSSLQQLQPREVHKSFETPQSRTQMCSGCLSVSSEWTKVERGLKDSLPLVTRSEAATDTKLWTCEDVKVMKWWCMLTAAAQPQNLNAKTPEPDSFQRTLLCFSALPIVLTSLNFPSLARGKLGWHWDLKASSSSHFERNKHCSHF